MAIIDGIPATSLDKADREWIMNVASEMGSGGSSGLPEVTTSDNGKVLGVSNGEWGVVSKGWSIEETTSTLCEESITTASGEMGISGTLAYNTGISADKIYVTWEGTEYECTKGVGNGIDAYYGGIVPNAGPVFTDYPFGIVVFGNQNMVFTENAGTYSIKIEAVTTNVEISDDFEIASKAVLADFLPLKIEFNTTTWQEVADAITAGKMVYAVPSGSHYINPVLYADDTNYTLTCATILDGDIATVSYESKDGTASGVITIK